MNFKDLTVGVLKEIMDGEKRVAATPETVGKLVAAGATVLVESGAGEDSMCNDEEYRRAGAEIVSQPEDIFNRADIILKVKEPLFNSKIGKHEAELFKPNQVLVTFLHPANPANHDTVRTLARQGVISFTMDSVPRISRAQQMDALTSMSTIAGYKAVILAANRLPRFLPMMPTAAGIIPPAQVLVVGTGVAGLQAVATAKRLGAKVKSIDIRPDANEQAKSLGAEIIPFDVPQELAVGQGGYARRLPEEWYQREREILAPHVQGSDVVILTALIPGEKAPLLVDQQMLAGMKESSVIVDVSVDQGGNCELTRPGEEYLYNKIWISGFLNIPASVAESATRMYAQNIFNFLNHVVREGRVDSSAEDEIIQKALVTKDGRIVHQGTLLAMENPS